MHAFPMVPIEGFEKLPMEDQAEHAAYRDPDTGKLYVPGVAVQRALVGGAVYSKGKGRGSLQKVAAACLFVTPDRLSLGMKDYAIDSRRVVIPATKGAIIRHRPRIDDWQITFNLEWDETLVTEQQVRKVVDDTLSRVGLLDFRPEKKGPFGRAMVTKWQMDGESSE